jgi:hypothetical protein
MKKKDLEIYFVILFSLSSIIFFYPHRININKLYYFYFILFFSVVLYIIANLKGSLKNSFTSPIILLLVAALISGFSATIFWGQPLFNSIKVLIFFFSYILFVLLVILKLRVNDIEKIIIILGVLYILVYTMAFLAYPNQIVGLIRWGDNRGFPRILLTGIGVLFLFSFYSLGKFFQNRKSLWLIIYRSYIS